MNMDTLFVLGKIDLGKIAISSHSDLDTYCSAWNFARANMLSLNATISSHVNLYGEVN